MLIKTKYYMPDPIEGGTPPAQEAPLTPAQAMARMGTVAHEVGLSGIATQQSNTSESPATPQQTPAPPAASATQEPAQQTEPAKTTEPEKTPAPETPKTVAPLTVKEKPWQEVLKSQQPEVVLKELLGDDNMVGLIKHWQSKGDLKDYLVAMTTDYSKMADQDVMRHQLERDYPEFSKQEIEILYRKKVVEAYNLSDDYTDQERMEGAVMLKAEAQRARQVLVADQQTKLLKPPPEAAPVVDTKARYDALVETELAAYKTQVESHAATKDMLSSGKLSFGEGENKFYVPVDNPQEIIEMAYNTEKYGEVTENLDISHHLFINAYAKDPAGTMNRLAQHWMALGAKKVVDPIENPSQPGGVITPQSEAPPKSIAEAMARGGRIVTS